MDDPNDRRNSAFRAQQSRGAQRWRSIRFVGGSYRIPLPPGPPPPELSKAQREQEARAEEDAAPALRLLAGGLSVGAIVMGLVLAAVVVMAVLVLMTHH
jgi:hypothetical protein